MIHYKIVCDCAGSNAIYDVAHVADWRDDGGDIFVIPSSKSWSYERRDEAVNRRGDHGSPHCLRCPGRCGREVLQITDKTVGEVLDKIAPARDRLAVWRIPEQRRPQWLNELIDLVGFREARVIPFSTFCVVVTSIGNSR